MMDEKDKTKEEKQISELKEKMSAAIRAKDVDGAIAPFAEQSVMFVLAPPLRFTTGVNAPGANGVREWLDSFSGAIGYEFRELEITVGGDAAFCHSLDHLTGKRINGEETDVWLRETLGLRKIAGEWRITHQHQSVPFYMDGSGRAATDLKP